MSIEELTKNQETTTDQNKSDNEKKETDRKPVYTPATDVYSDEEKYLLVLDLPGVKESDLEISLEKDELKIVGKTSLIETDGNLRYSEYRTGDYRRSFAISEPLDEEKISAVLSNGILKVTLPRRKPSIKKIEVKTN
ncbi:Hsp20/alpha crystallin family protein [Leptospira inadai serovar Lyme str. 10]|uniref:Hsp20/alpha crystallin family protein n=2 Tax=Leptospira inadai serovar Lyme TaxID=293084 RepID=V6HVH0_9LEPT|nr:Hsp20/alpha crystallin family protein [Leptospira inadai]EQA36839.1 Hsp20/alpha crystallin family protein [Leptospira inadai serovar Lyme str. 10]PNV76486.1 heat-shock protein [Leptospira inadai serovar Lyme]